jgi:hypothetical protein
MHDATNGTGCARLQQTAAQRLIGHMQHISCTSNALPARLALQLPLQNLNIACNDNNLSSAPKSPTITQRRIVTRRDGRGGSIALLVRKTDKLAGGAMRTAASSSAQQSFSSSDVTIGTGATNASCSGNVAISSGPSCS